MKYALVFLVASLVFVVLAFTFQGLAWLLLWPALNLVCLAYAYAENQAEILGKRPDGGLRIVAVLFYLPYFGLTWLCWSAYVRLLSEAWSDEVAPGIWVGRRPAPQHIPSNALVVDMTAEFPTHPKLRVPGDLLVLPTLDARSPGSAVLRDLAQTLSEQTRPVYVHCAQGHGRSATLAAVILVIRGDALSIAAALEQMSSARPGVHLHSIQLRDAEKAISLHMDRAEREVLL